MISNLREKLKTMYTVSHSTLKEDGSKNIILTKGNLGGEVVKNQWGKHVYKRTEYPKNHIYGSISFEGIENIHIPLAFKWARLEGEDDGFGIDDLIFLDTETTGLSGGTGTLAFLVGVGYFKEKNFIIEQHIMRDFDEELSMLNGIIGVMKSKKLLITFNGKSYDYPLIENRMILNRIPWSMNYRDKGLHLDLLHPSRRIWASMLKSCNLTSLETNILGKRRLEDISGYEIPGIYYQYLEDGAEKSMLGVIEHNIMDILAMVALFIKLSTINQHPYQLSLKCHEWYGLAKSWESQGDEEMAIYCYLKSIELDKDKYIEFIAKDRLAMLYKKRRQWKEALKLWESIIDNGTGEIKSTTLLPLIEIAKYYEHYERDYDSALLYTERALRTLTGMGDIQGVSHGLYDIKTIKHRRNRLIKKRRDEAKCQ